MIKVGQVYQGRAFEWTVSAVIDAGTVLMDSWPTEGAKFSSFNGTIPGMTLISEPPGESDQAQECKYKPGDSLISKIGTIRIIKSVDEESQTCLIVQPSGLLILYEFNVMRKIFSHRPAPKDSPEERSLGDRMRDVYAKIAKDTLDALEEELVDPVSSTEECEPELFSNNLGDLKTRSRLLCERNALFLRRYSDRPLGEFKLLEDVDLGVDIVVDGEYSHLLAESYVVLPGKGPKLVK